MAGNLPTIALAVRQPWAWAIIHAGKDIENRTLDAVAKGLMRPARIAIYAGKSMTRGEYEFGRGAIARVEAERAAYGPLERDARRTLETIEAEGRRRLLAAAKGELLEAP